MKDSSTIATLIAILIMSSPGIMAVIAFLSYHDDNINLTRKRYDAIINSNSSEPNNVNNNVVIDKHFKRIFPSMSISSLKKLTQLQMKLDDANINIDIRNRLYYANKNKSQNIFSDVTSFTYEYTNDIIKLMFLMPNGVYMLTFSGVKGLNKL